MKVIETVIRMTYIPSSPMTVIKRNVLLGKTNKEEYIGFPPHTLIIERIVTRNSITTVILRLNQDRHTCKTLSEKYHTHSKNLWQRLYNWWLRKTGQLIIEHFVYDCVDYNEAFNGRKTNG